MTAAVPTATPLTAGEAVEIGGADESPHAEHRERQEPEFEPQS